MAFEKDSEDVLKYHEIDANIDTTYQRRLAMYTGTGGGHRTKAEITGKTRGNRI